MDNDDERDYEEEAYNRRTMEEEHEFMPYREGTLVTRYMSTSDSSGVRTCTGGVCVGKVIEIIAYRTNPDNPTIVVKWLDLCDWHKGGNPYALQTKRHLSDELWEIGQTT